MISDNDNDFDSEIINSNVQKAIDKLDEEDLHVENIMDYDDYDDNSYPENRFHDESDDNDADKHDVIPADNRDVICADNCDVSAKVVRGGSNAGFMDEIRKRQRIEGDDSFYYDNPDYRPPNFGDSQSECGSIRNSSSLSFGAENNGNAHEWSTSTNDYDAWRTKHDGHFFKFVSFDNRGFGRHKKMLNKMEMSGSAKDQNLLSVLREVTEQQTGQEKEATQFSTETPTDEYNYGDVIEGSDVNLQVRNGSEGKNKTERANDVNVQGNDGEPDIAPAENEAKHNVSLEKKKMNGCGHDVNRTVEGSGVNLQVRNGSEGKKKLKERMMYMLKVMTENLQM